MIVWTDEDIVEAVFHQLDAAAAARVQRALTAEDVMTRRGWWTEKVGDRWYLAKGCMRELEIYEWGVAHDFGDPFTALVEADRWYKENVEK